MRPNGFRFPGLSPGAIRTQPAPNGSPTARLVEQEGFGANPGALRMFRYAPASLPKNAPLVVILHGCTQNAAGYDTGAGWSQLADRAGFAVLAPEQTRENNINGCFNWFLPGDTERGQGEAASIRQMIEHAINAYDLDSKRVFITGLSAGGAMTAAMLGAYPEIFAGGAVIAGLPIGGAANVSEALNCMRHAASRSPQEWGTAARSKSNHDGPWPRLSVWHGDADMTVHPSNAEALIVQWTQLHSVGAVPSHDKREGTHRYRSWQDNDGIAVVEAFTLNGMGHGTPLNASAQEKIGRTGLYFPDAGISSTERIAAFWHIADASKAEHSAERVERRAVMPGSRVGDVILKALQSSGLMK